MLSRYIVFTGVKDQVQSGWGSFYGSYCNLSDAIRDAEAETDTDDGDTWAQVVDTDEMSVVKEFGYEVPS